jgi:hypothetical protein
MLPVEGTRHSFEQDDVVDLAMPFGYPLHAPAAKPGARKFPVSRPSGLPSEEDGKAEHLDCLAMLNSQDYLAYNNLHD